MSVLTAITVCGPERTSPFSVAMSRQSSRISESSALASRALLPRICGKICLTFATARRASSS